MLHPGFLKPRISIKQVGKRRFWTGIVIGLCSGILLNYFFNYSREVMRYLTGQHDLLILTSKEYTLYDLFFSSISAVLGFGITTSFWFHRIRQPFRKRHYLYRAIITNIWLNAIVTILVIVRFGSVLGILIFGIYGIEDYLNLKNNYSYILILLPVVLFFNFWIYIQRILKSFKWVVLSVIALTVFITLLWIITPVNRNISDNLYYEHYKDVFMYIDKELKRADSLGINYDKTTINTLKKFYNPKSEELANEIKGKFSSDEEVSLKYIILEKILVHKSQEDYKYYFKREWDFALPAQIYHQILMHDPSDIEVLHLFKLLREEIGCFDDEQTYTVGCAGDDSEEITYTFYHDGSYNGLSPVKVQLMNVRQRLLEDPTYKRYHYLLNDLKLTWEEEIMQSEANEFFKQDKSN